MKTLTLEEWDAILEDEAELQKAKEFGYALYPKTRYGPLVQVAESDDDLRALLRG
jgi:hypothetical protein